MDNFVASTLETIDADQNSYVCEAMEGVSISSSEARSDLATSSNHVATGTTTTTMPSARTRPKKPIPPPLVLRDDQSSSTINSLLTEFAIIATSPRSPLMQKNLPIRKRAYSFPSLDTAQHSYGTAPQPLTPPPGLLSPPSSHVSCSSLNSSSEEIRNRISPMSLDCGGGGSEGLEDNNDSGQPDATNKTTVYQWPTAVWQCFLKGVHVQIEPKSRWLCVEELAQMTEENGELQHYAPNGLHLLDDFGGDEATTKRLRLRFAPVDPVPYPQPSILVEFGSDHPFFVKDKGWSSARTDLTAKTYGIPCRPLHASDVCLPPSHPEATFTSDVFESVKNYDFTPEDTSAVFALSSMAKKQLQPTIVPAFATMSPPISPVKKCVSTNGIDVVAAVDFTKRKRPMNGFMLFAKQYRIQYTQLHPGKDNRAISVLLGITWKRMSNDERSIYCQQARIMAEEQKKLHPDCWKRRRSSSTCS